MKLRNLFFAALSVFALAACNDTPDSPYNPGGGNGNENGGTTVTGDNLLKNSSFETWAEGKPTSWGLTVTNGTYSQSNGQTQVRVLCSLTDMHQATSVLLQRVTLSSPVPTHWLLT